jgi:hypothetical protein
LIVEVNMLCIFFMCDNVCVYAMLLLHDLLALLGCCGAAVCLRRHWLVGVCHACWSVLCQILNPMLREAWLLLTIELAARVLLLAGR